MAAQIREVDNPSKALLEAISRSTRNLEQPIGPYQADAMRKLKDECARLYDEVLRLMDGGDAQIADLDDAVKAALVVHHQTILRNKAVAVFYTRERLAVLTRLRIEAGAALPPALRANCTASELDFFAAYDELHAAYAEGVGVDLRGTLKPPRDLFVEIRCNVDCGEIVTRHSGAVRLDKGTSHFLRRADVEHLVSQGLVSHVVTAPAAA